MTALFRRLQPPKKFRVTVAREGKIPENFRIYNRAL